MILEEGNIAPNFQGTDQFGKHINLSELKGSKVLLYFYPKDDTPGCTAEACNLKDNYSKFQKEGYVVIGVSPDTIESHKKFTTKYALPFSLLPDPAKTIIQLYGVWGTKNMYGKMVEGILRTSFIINEQGVIEKVIKKVDTKNHHTQIFK